MNKERLIKLSSVFDDAAKQDDEELVKLLLDKGVSIEDAERIVAFLPVAFGRVVISKIGRVNFSNICRIKENGKEFNLYDEAIYCIAEDLANECTESGLMPKDTFSAIATRSVELNAVNQALNSGADINGASFQPVLLWGYKTIGMRKSFLGRLFSSTLSDLI